MLRPWATVRTLDENCPFWPLGGRPRNMRQTTLMTPFHRMESCTKSMGAPVRIVLAMPTCMDGLWSAHSDRTHHVERERERERLSTCQDSAPSDAHPRPNSPPQTAPSHGPTLLAPNAPWLSFGLIEVARGAHHEPRQTVPTERPKNRPYTPGGRVKSPNCKKCVNIRISALYARYGPQTRAPASWFDRLGAWVAWVKRGKVLVYLPLPGKAKG